MKKTARRGKKLLLGFLIVGIIAILIPLIAFFGIYFSVALDTDTIIHSKADILLYDRYNEEIPASDISRYVPYSEISINIINAFVAMEDKRFFSHNGIDYIRLGGAFLEDIKAGYFKEGGSTITQQLAKNTQLSNEKSIVRKIKEMRLARQIEREFSKEEILEMYLNAIYYGNGIYGIDSACKNYFNCSAAEITVSEAAYLAGVVKNPKKYSPLNNPKEADGRKNLVLRLMLEQGYIDNSEYQQELSVSYVAPKDNGGDPALPYYNNAIDEAADILGISEKELIRSGYRIYTYYNAEKQNLLFQSFLSKEFESVNANKNAAAYSALLSENIDGGISAYYGNFRTSVFDLRRQPGSAIKPIIVYAPALEANYINASTPVLDEKMSYGGYSPSNYGGSYLGWIDVKSAVKTSSNAVAVQLLDEISVDYGKRIAARMGLQFSDGDNNLALALGGMEYGVTSVELLSAYMTLANGGMYVKNTFVKEIYDKNGNKVYENSRQGTRAVSEETAYLMTDMLIETAKTGTAKKLSTVPYAVAAKTGTVSFQGGENNLDAWCIGYSTEHTLCVWYGDIDKAEDKAIETTGGGYPALLASYLFQHLTVGKESFQVPYGIVELEIDEFAWNKEKKLYIASDLTPKRFRKKELFCVGNCPQDQSPYFRFEQLKFNLSFENSLVTVQFEGEEEFQYRLVKEDFFTGERTYLDGFQKNIHGQSVCTDNQLQRFSIYNYYLEVYYENQLLFSGENKLVFT